MSKIYLGFQVLGHVFVVGKLPAIIVGDRIHPIFMRGESLVDRVSDFPGCLMENSLYDRKQRFTLNQCDQGAFVPLADDGIPFPVTEAFPIGYAACSAFVFLSLGGEKTTILPQLASQPHTKSCTYKLNSRLRCPIRLIFLRLDLRYSELILVSPKKCNTIEWYAILRCYFHIIRTVLQRKRINFFVLVMM